MLKNSLLSLKWVGVWLLSTEGGQNSKSLLIAYWLYYGFCTVERSHFYNGGEILVSFFVYCVVFLNKEYKSEFQLEYSELKSLIEGLSIEVWAGIKKPPRHIG